MSGNISLVSSRALANRICQTDWDAFDNLTEAEVIVAAIADPDAQPFGNGAVKMHKEDGRTVLERFRRPLNGNGETGFTLLNQIK